MTKVFSIDVTIVATAYIRASSQEEAERLLQDRLLTPGSGELPTSDGSNSANSIVVSGAFYDSPYLPQISISPAITVKGEATREAGLQLATASPQMSLRWSQVDHVV